MSEHAVATQTRPRFVIFTVIAGAVAAVAAFTADSLSFPAWAMFVGWVAWFSRPASPVQGLHAMVCLWLGLVLAAAGQLLAGVLAPVTGAAALPLAVFVLALVVVGLRTTPVLNNMLAWFLGLIAFYAAHSNEIASTLLSLAAATAIGAAAGFACQRLQRQFA
ncbi:Protein of unknown function [Lentzea xinjiangensis]|uniref:DUF1097 domain-containing protein n=1 Tax=Lentzea xinjiangensis TaxID=402600 RepID=A0A1H9NDA5_9PSEU|nr:DUF1097 domain-containing protein [Lentzea xinjiangensis]SER33924.1 Protein of unknown function [Lentzea xinjiangensis]